MIQVVSRNKEYAGSSPAPGTIIKRYKMKNEAQNINNKKHNK